MLVPEDCIFRSENDLKFSHSPSVLILPQTEFSYRYTKNISTLLKPLFVKFSLLIHLPQLPQDQSPRNAPRHLHPDLSRRPYTYRAAR